MASRDDPSLVHLMFPTALVAVFALLLLLPIAYRALVRPWLFGVFCGAGVTVLLLAAGRVDLQWFTWAKVFSVITGMTILLALPRGRGVWLQRLKRAMVAVLILNILEAVVADVFLGNLLNGLIGLSLIATLPGPGQVSIERKGGWPLVCYPLSWVWIATYTAWDFAVVCAVYPTHWFDHVGVLSAPILVALWFRDPRAWLEARAFTLGVFALVIVLVIDVAQRPWIPGVPQPSWLLTAFTSSALFLAVWNVIETVRLRRAAFVRPPRD